MKSVVLTRRQWLRAAALLPPSRLLAARKDFWESKDPASWTSQEKDIVLYQSPWARDGAVRVETEKKRTEPGYNSKGQVGYDMPDTRPGVPAGGVKSVPIGEEVPRAPKVDTSKPIEFRAMARWETAKPVRLAGGPEVPEMTGQFYVIRLRGLPLMPPPKPKPGEPAPADPNAELLPAIKMGSSLERVGKPPIPCAHLFTGTGNASTEVLLFFPHGADPITLADKLVTLECRFALFHLSIKFPLKDMVYRGELSL
jgi:hypothetical protein